MSSDTPETSLKIAGESDATATALHEELDSDRHPTELQVFAGGRWIQSQIYFPDQYNPNHKYPAVVAMHGLSLSASDYYTRGNFERLRRDGDIVILPEAGNWNSWLAKLLTATHIVADKRAWQSSTTKGVRVTPLWIGHYNNNVDDVEGVIGTLKAAEQSYAINKNQVSFYGFSQGVSIATEAARRLDTEKPGAVKNLFLVSGTVSPMPPDSLEGTNVVHYFASYDYVEGPANILGGSLCNPLPGGKGATDNIMSGKGPPISLTPITIFGEHIRDADFADKTQVIEIEDPNGQHCVPGQPLASERWWGYCSVQAGNPLDFEKLSEEMINYPNESIRKALQSAITLEIRQPSLITPPLSAFPF